MLFQSPKGMKHYTALPLFGSWNVLALQTAFGFLLGFVSEGFFWRSSAGANLSLTSICPYPYALCSGNSSPLGVWCNPYLGEDLCWKLLATPSLLDRAGLESSPALKWSCLGTTAQKHKQSLPEWVLTRHIANISRGGLVFIQLLLGYFFSKHKAWWWYGYN